MQRFAFLFAFLLAFALPAEGQDVSTLVTASVGTQSGNVSNAGGLLVTTQSDQLIGAAVSMQGSRDRVSFGLGPTWRMGSESALVTALTMGRSPLPGSVQDKTSLGLLVGLQYQQSPVTVFFGASQQGSYITHNGYQDTRMSQTNGVVGLGLTF